LNPVKIFNNEWVGALEVQNLVETSEMMARAALMKEETRGDHHRKDFPNEDPEWKRNIVIKKEGRGMKLTTQLVE
jgi:succinate dehydrogenase/fumarate reductase flavoprotein subunit